MVCWFLGDRCLVDHSAVPIALIPACTFHATRADGAAGAAVSQAAEEPRAIFEVWLERRRLLAISFPPSPAVLPIGQPSASGSKGRVRSLPGHAESDEEGANGVRADKQVAGEALSPSSCGFGVHRETSVGVRDMDNRKHMLKAYLCFGNMLRLTRRN